VSDVIERLLEVESRARRLIAEAERDAARTVDEARRQAQQTAKSAREEAKRKADELLATGLDAARKDMNEKLERQKAQLPPADAAEPRAVEQAVDLVARVIAYGDEGAR